MKIAMVLSTLGSVVRAVNGSERAAMGLANGLVSRGHEVWITNLLNRTPEWEQGFDVLHCVNAGGPKGPYLGAIKTARFLGIPTVTSTIYWPVAEQYKEMAFAHQWSDRQQKEQVSILPEWEKQTQMLFLESDMLLPNAQLEMQSVVELIDKSPELMTRYDGIPPYAVIPNAVDFKNEIDPVARCDEELPEGLLKRLPKRFVLCVGRIEARKNQIRLVQAMTRLWEEGDDIGLVLVGRVTPQYIAGINWATLPILLHDETSPRRCIELMRRCTVYAQPSLLETPGLATLEAAALGKPIVSGRNATEEEYFGEHAYYCEPTDVDSIYEALKIALEEGRVSTAGSSARAEMRARHVRENYSYERATEALEEAYRRAVDSLNRGGD